MDHFRIKLTFQSRLLRQSFVIHECSVFKGFFDHSPDLILRHGGRHVFHENLNRQMALYVILIQTSVICIWWYPLE